MGHVKKIQKLLNRWNSGIRIGILHAERAFRVLFKGGGPKKYDLLLLLNGAHYDLIYSTKKLFQVSFFGGIKYGKNNFLIDKRRILPRL